MIHRWRRAWRWSRRAASTAGCECGDRYRRRIAAAAGAAGVSRADAGAESRAGAAGHGGLSECGDGGDPGFSSRQPPVAAAPPGPSGKRLIDAAAGPWAGAVRAEGARQRRRRLGRSGPKTGSRTIGRRRHSRSPEPGAAVGGMATRADRRQERRQQGPGATAGERLEPSL
jgi:hypothetical protein